MCRGSTTLRLTVLLTALATGHGTVRATDAPLPDSRLGIRTAPLLLLSRPDVRHDLGLSVEQQAEADRAIRSLYAEAAALRGKPDAEALPARRAVDAMQVRWLAEHLTAEQQSRLEQIDLQWEGPSALITRPSVAQILSLTEPQRSALAQAVAARHRLRVEGGNPIDDERRLAEQAMEILRPEQKELWNELLGRPMVFQPAGPLEPEGR